jgi:nucleotide-binding universal stress UspA family protein
MTETSTSTGADSPPAPPRGHVVVGFDGSSAAEAAVDLAADEAIRRHTTLEVLHALEWVEFGGGKDRFGQQLRENAHDIANAGADRARRRHHDLRVLATVEVATSIDTLEGASDRAALLVVGSRGLGGFAGLLMGSVSLPVTAVSRCPLLVVHPQKYAPSDADDGRIVVGISDDECAPALEAAFAQARTRGVAVHALHAWNHPAATATGAAFAALWDMNGWRNAAMATLHAAVAPLREKYPDVDVSEDIVSDSPSHALITASADAALVVLAAHRNTGRFGSNLGRVTHTVLHHAKAPVLLVPVGP